VAATGGERNDVSRLDGQCVVSMSPNHRPRAGTLPVVLGLVSEVAKLHDLANGGHGQRGAAVPARGCVD